jgi:hypothetical protein
MDYVLKLAVVETVGQIPDVGKGHMSQIIQVGMSIMTALRNE